MELLSNEQDLRQNPAIRMRCPSCLKLYSVLSSSISEPRPKFECMSCKTHFWVPFPECLEQKEIIAFPLQWLDPNFQKDQKENNAPSKEAAKPILEDCPKCTRPYAKGLSECPSCGVIFAKYSEPLPLEVSAQAYKAAPSSVGGPQRLKNIWDKITANYEDTLLHDEFLKEGHREGALAYASQQYRRMLSIDPDDELARKMIQKITALSQAPMEMVRSVPIKHILMERLGFSGFMMILSLLMMGIGYMVPILRNIVGAGAALFFFALAVRIYFSARN